MGAFTTVCIFRISPEGLPAAGAIAKGLPVVTIANDATLLDGLKRRRDQEHAIYSLDHVLLKGRFHCIPNRRFQEEL